MRINVAIPEAHVKKPVLDGALEAVTRLNESLLKAGEVPTDLELLARGARWQPEPPGDEHFDHAGIIAKRGFGDCDDWAPIRAARLRVTGEDPGARAVVRQSGEKRWHATVLRSDGREDDPSLDAGMPGRGVQGYRPPWMPMMFSRVHGVGGTYIAQPSLALRPIADAHGQVESWQARADLPWHTPLGDAGDVAMVTLHRSPVSSQAIVGAVRGAWSLGLCSGLAHPEHLRRMSAIGDACEGAEWEDLVQRYGPEHARAASQIVGSFFGKALKKMGKLAKGVAKGALKVATPALSLIPGGGIAAAAFNAASPMLKKALMKQKHKPPAERAPVLISRQPPPVQSPPARSAAAPPLRPVGPPAPAGGNWLPYPYPVPYPVPGWSGAGGFGPGTAWPPR